MAEKVLSVFIDESGDFGAYDFHAPFYLVAMVLHNQEIDITKNIDVLEKHLANLGYKQHAIHTGPLIRRSSAYADDLMEDRKRLFNALFNFARKLDFHYVCAKIRKDECSDVITLTARISKMIAEILRSHQNFWEQFNRIIIYYDNGQIELTKILTSVFNECPILQAEEGTRQARLQVTNLVQAVLRDACSLLGLQCPEEM